jgi:hypothetical protein
MGFKEEKPPAGLLQLQFAPPSIATADCGVRPPLSNFFELQKQHNPPETLYLRHLPYHSLKLN